MARLIQGTAGGDTLYGETGDTLDGAAGDDTYIIYDPSAVIFDAFNAGNGGYDRVLTFVSFDIGETAQVEVLSTADNAGVQPLDLAGNGGTQVIVGNYGANVLRSRGGGDTLYGLRGDDTYYVSAGDRVVENGGEGVDFVYVGTSYALDAGSSIEWLGSVAPNADLAANLTGNALTQTIVGSGGADVLDGRGGADTLIGLGGNDTYRVYGPADAVVEAVNGGVDTVYTSGNFYLAGGASIETVSAADQGLSSSMYLLGNELDQRMIGDYGANTLNGGGSRGGDTLVGLRGDDTYRIFGQNDVVVEAAGEGADTIYTSGNYRLAAGVEVEVLSSWSHIATTGINLTGNELGNVVIGTYGVNVLDGGGGADTLIGLEGGDVFRFTAAPVAGSVTTVRDYGVGVDVVLLDSRAFTQLADGVLAPGALAYGAAAADADDRIVYDASTGALSYDADGNGSGAAIQFARLPTNVALSDLRIVVASVPPEQLTTNTPGTYLIGDAVGQGTAIPSSVTNVTFNPYGIGYYFDLVFGASTSNGAVPSIRFTGPDLPGRLDFSQLRQGVVTRPDQGYSTAAGQLLLAEPPAPSGPTAPFPSAVVGTAFDDVIDRIVGNGFGVGTVTGGAGNDFIRGARLADGGAGDDRLFATISTTLTGGAGADLFDLPIRTRQPGTNSGSAFNVVTDFNPAEDRINLVLNYSGGLLPVDLVPGPVSASQFYAGTAPTSPDQRIFYNTATGELSFLVRGNAGSAAGEIPVFARLPANLDLTADDFTFVLV
ncbi:calcium-binding protein [Sphingomonas lenta]|uniref:Calcium-binding protein n=1 Tax=Sphingomonas lenta TaxID=1141887 RepID=A0A2A2SD35_9SPHN|nr:calcium-binding protein [Sphingomonas lenta]PAX07110.1 hypothetical protein CKY28_13775 [Sphingomonas lenta]